MIGLTRKSHSSPSRNVTRYQRRAHLERLEDRWVLALSAFDIFTRTGTVATGAPEISWEASTEAIQYDVVVSDQADLSAPLRTFDDVVGTSVTVDPPLPDGIYYVGVRAARANMAPVVDAGEVATLDEGSWPVSLGSFTDPENIRTAENQGLVFTVAAEPVGQHTIFVTSMSSTIDRTQVYPPNSPNFGGLTAADYVVTELAYYAGLIDPSSWDFCTPIYTAILSTPDVDARDRFDLSGPLYNMQGELVAVEDADLWDGNLTNPVQYNEFGVSEPSGTNIWTGTFPNGTWAGDSCGAWNESTGAAETSNDPLSTGNGWISGDVITCDDHARLYGVSPAFVAEPGETQGAPLPPTSVGTTDPLLFNFEDVASAQWFEVPPTTMWEVTATSGALFTRLTLPAGFTGIYELDVDGQVTNLVPAPSGVAGSSPVPSA